MSHQTTKPELIEAPGPLSASALWEVQRSYFRSKGIDAWRTGDVPDALTSSPALAWSFAHMIEAFLGDCAKGSFGPVDREEPVYVVELGAGTGRFGFHLRTALTHLAEASPPLFRVVYVLTDMAESNIAFWRDHPKLLPFMDDGILDMAIFDPITDRAIRLERSGVLLEKGSIANPMVAIANYLFCVQPQDLFAIDGGVLSEDLVGLTSSGGHVDLGSEGWIGRLWYLLQRIAVGADRYGDSELDALLGQIVAQRSGEKVGGVLTSGNGTLTAGLGADEACRDPAWSGRRFLFPLGALRSMGALLEISGRRLMTLVAERLGGLQEIAVIDGLAAAPAVPDGSVPCVRISSGQEAPAVLISGSGSPTGDTHPEKGMLVCPMPAGLFGMGVHGDSFSLPVDLEILGLYAQQLGARFNHISGSNMNMAAGVFVDGDNGSASGLYSAFQHNFVEASPFDRFAMALSHVQSGSVDLDPPTIMALLRMVNFDSRFLINFHGSLLHKLPQASQEEKIEAGRILRLVWRSHYPIGGEADMALSIAVLLASCGDYTAALDFLGHSRDEFGDGALTLYTEAVCWGALGEVAAARLAVTAALSMDPDFEPALALSNQLAACE